MQHDSKCWEGHCACIGLWCIRLSVFEPFDNTRPLFILYLGSEQHFMTKMGADGSADERFVDVFRSGVLLNRCAPNQAMQSIELYQRPWQVSQLFHPRKRV